MQAPSSCSFKAKLIAICLLISATASICKASTEEAKIAIYEKIIANRSLPVDECALRADSILALTNDPAKRKATIQSKADLYFDAERYSSCAKEYQRILKEKYPLSESEYCHLQYRLIYSNVYTTNYRDAYLRATALKERTKPDSLKYYDTLSEIMRLNIYLKNSHKPTADYLNRLEEQVKELDVPANVRNEVTFQWLNCKLNYLSLIGDWDQMNKVLDSAWKYAPSKLDTDILRIFNAWLHDELGEYDMSRKIYEQILAENPTDGIRCIVVNNYGDLLLEEGKPQETIKLLENNKAYIDRLEMELIRCHILNISSMAYEAVGDYQKAYMAKKEVYNKFEEISTDVNREFVDLMSENEMENLRLTQENLLQQNSNKLTLIFALILLLIIIISIAVSLWRRYNKRKQVAESLSERIETIDETHRQKEATSKRTIEERNRELAALSLRMAQVDKSVNLIAGIAKEESLSEAERISKISKLVKDIDVQENIWDMVSVAFERTRQSFFSELYRRHPDLTQGEIRMCAYMLMGMSTKEIALLTNRSSRTVDTIKYNMRKKMAITEPTESYLRRIASAE